MTARVRVKWKESDHPRDDIGRFTDKPRHVVVRLKYSENQPRDEDGRWTSTGYVGGGPSETDYLQVFDRWPIHEDTFMAGGNAVKIRRWLRQNAPDGRVTVGERTGNLFLKLGSRLRDGRLLAAVQHLSGGPGYEVNMTEFKK